MAKRKKRVEQEAEVVVVPVEKAAYVAYMADPR